MGKYNDICLICREPMHCADILVFKVSLQLFIDKTFLPSLLKVLFRSRIMKLTKTLYIFLYLISIFVTQSNV
jgi:hypothetical protein